jgi:hypothetical protein
VEAKKRSKRVGTSEGWEEHTSERKGKEGGGVERGEIQQERGVYCK